MRSRKSWPNTGAMLGLSSAWSQGDNKHILIILKSMYKPTTCRSSSWHVDVQCIAAEVPVGRGQKGINWRGQNLGV